MPTDAREEPDSIPIRDCFDPLTKSLGPGEYQVSRKRLAFLREHHPWEYYNSHTAREALRDPERVYIGLREGVNGWCFVQCPERVRNAAGKHVPIPDGMVWVAFVTDARDLYHWGLEEADKNDPTKPRGANDGRFGGELWKKH